MSLQLKDTLSNQLEKLEGALYKKDIGAMRELQKVIDKEHYSRLSAMPMDSLLNSKMSISKLTELQRKAPTLYDVLLYLGNVLALSKETYELISKIVLS